MTLGDLIVSFRSDVDDVRPKYLWPDADVIRWMAEAEEEAAIRKRLLFDDYTTAMTVINVIEGTRAYVLDERWFALTNIRIYDADSDEFLADLHVTTRDELDGSGENWRPTDPWQPRWLIQEDTRLVVAGTPERDYTMRVEGYRTPLVPMSAEAGDVDSQRPEIAAVHHRRLVDWAIYRAYQKPDSETLNPQAGAQALDRFTKYFGIRPDADLFKDTRAEQPHRTKAWW